ncbi:hypothetical protein KUTeg_011311 [Tegillarca granosa]|uniref:Uncharacterized protein n=1 Tax=Tegillarca granosa TaxID=220873 RepID=A0ABQ9F170_TEGGR|nr:hypothetical protein KUTeg_011311 [Tegillarca granosa]
MAGLSGIGVCWAFSSLLAAIASCIGFYLPFWLRGAMGDNPVYFGVFRRCNYPRTDSTGTLIMVNECGRYSTFDDIPSLSWKIATLTIGVGCGVAMLVSLTAILAVCIRGIVSLPVARVAGILQLCAACDTNSTDLVIWSIQTCTMYTYHKAYLTPIVGSKIGLRRSQKKT